MLLSRAQGLFKRQKTGALGEEIGGSGETVGSDEARGQERQGTHKRLARQGSRFLDLIKKTRLLEVW